MSKREYVKKTKEDKPVLAICYDFDKTLTPDNMQAQGYIQSLGFEITDDFWRKANGLSDEYEMDQNLSCMYEMLREADGKVLFNRETLHEFGLKIRFFPGVESWFERIREYGRNRGVIVEHYIISSGMKEMIEGTTVARAGAFEKIYASSFYFENGRSAKWPAQVINYMNKTQFLFRIATGVPDINDPSVNDYIPREELRVPLRNMVYIGDSDTDVPCMMLVNSFGGHSIGVYDNVTQDKTKVYKMMRENRIKYFVPADYSEGTELDMLLKAIIDKTAAAEKLERIHEIYKKENVEADRLVSKEELEKIDLISALDDSFSISRTRQVVSKLKQIKNWSKEHAERLFEIAEQNSQVRSVLEDEEVKEFYKELAEEHKLDYDKYLKLRKRSH
ncbi:MAG: haloacid dehalogenase-like hydrolase [Synergistes sp.]|nr:haloacid dehalogenase-like hydrolase [Synergistes sp.]